MRVKAIAMLMVMGVAVGFAQTPQPSPQTLNGVWRGQMDGLPEVVLTLTDEGGKLSGAVLFFLHVRATVNDPWNSRPSTEAEPLLNPVFDGKTLRFEVSHKRAHPPGTLNDPPARFHMTLIGPDKAGLVNESEGGSADSGPGLPMVRSDY
jgi:hypothetical protein